MGLLCNRWCHLKVRIIWLISCTYPFFLWSDCSHKLSSSLLKGFLWFSLLHCMLLVGSVFKFWFNFGNYHLTRNLSISSSYSKLLESKFLKVFFVNHLDFGSVSCDFTLSFLIELLQFFFSVSFSKFGCVYFVYPFWRTNSCNQMIIRDPLFIFCMLSRVSTFMVDSTHIQFGTVLILASQHESITVAHPWSQFHTP